MRWISRNPADTQALARGLAAALDEGGVVGLCGALGAGKTEFAKGLAAGLGIDAAQLSSPTFVIAGELPTAPSAVVERLVHADFYRVEHEDELEMAGLADWLAPGTLLLAEWADRFPRELPADRLDIRIERPADGDPEDRIVSARALGGPGGRFERVLERWSEACP